MSFILDRILLEFLHTCVKDIRSDGCRQLKREYGWIELGTHVVLGVLISSLLLLTTVLEKQNLSALTSRDRYTSGFSYGAATDFQNNSTFNPVCVKHTNYYCTGYLKGYSVTWNNLSTRAPRLNPNSNPPASNSTSPPSKPSNTNASAPSIPYSVKWAHYPDYIHSMET